MLSSGHAKDRITEYRDSYKSYFSRKGTTERSVSAHDRARVNKAGVYVMTLTEESPSSSSPEEGGKVIKIVDPGKGAKGVAPRIAGGVVEGGGKKRHVRVRGPADVVRDLRRCRRHGGKPRVVYGDDKLRGGRVRRAAETSEPPQLVLTPHRKHIHVQSHQNPIPRRGGRR